MNGVGLNIIDTAGIRNTEDEVEKIGVEKARKYAEDADLVIYVVDASCALDENDEEVMEMIADKKVIVLLNKSDLEQVVSEDRIIKKLTQVSVRQVNKAQKIQIAQKNLLEIHR